MATLAETVTRICDDLSRPETELGGIVEREILTAIRHYETRRFTFNEMTLTPVLLPGTDYPYATLIGPASLSVEDIFAIDGLGVTYNNRQIPVTRENWPVLFDLDQLGTSSTIPSFYCTFEKKLTFYPRLSVTLSVDIQAHIKLRTLLSLAGSPTTNAWLTDAEELIRNRATGMVLAKKLDEFDKATFYRNMEVDELTRLQREAAVVQSTGKLAANF